VCLRGMGNLLIKSLSTQSEKGFPNNADGRPLLRQTCLDLQICMLCDGNEQKDFLELPVAQSSRHLSHACIKAVHSPMLAVQSCNMHTDDSLSALGVC
jgi:hypothetical protein